MTGIFLLIGFLPLISGAVGDCSLVQPPQWGTVRERVLKDGTLQTVYSCEPGRRLKGHKVLTCTTDGWNHPVPKCIPLDNRFRHIRNELYLGDDPISTTPSEQRAARDRMRARKRIGELKKRRKAKEKRKQRAKKVGGKTAAPEPSSLGSQRAALNETIMSRLDVSCFMKARRKGFAKAPLVENAHPPKYARRTNVLPPYNRYLVAVYECTEGHIFEDSMADRLFCSDGTWLGALPRCIKPGDMELNKMKRCNQDRGGCKQVCEDIETGVKCSCFDGYRLTDSSCQDIDECAEGAAGCAGICHNEPGSFHCECRPGYQLGNDKKSCLDVNECLVNNGHGPCQGTCTNLEGSYECSCEDIPGHRLAADNHTCEDIDECITDNGGCSHVCLNTPGSAFCLCPDGFYLTGDWKTCQDVNECENASKVCGNNTDCENTIGSFKCVGKPKKMTKVLQDEDYDAEDDDDDEDYDDEEDTVTEIPEFGKCEDGFRKNKNDECVDIDECVDGDEGEPHGCHHKCVNEPGGYYCVCYQGFQLRDDGVSCEDIDECQKNPTSCSHNCTNTIGSFICSCPPGTSLNEDNVTCAQAKTCETLTTPCSHECQDSEDGPICICPAGYQVHEDGTSCVDINECTLDLCSHSCTNLEGSFTCLCPDGLEISEADKFNCTDVDECAKDVHGCDHKCLNTHGSYSCDCHSGFALNSDGKTCADVNECLNGDHKCDQECVNSPGSYECLCRDGYKPSSDGFGCEDINECVEDKHGCSHECTNEAGGFICDCPAGFLLADDRKTCQDVNECLEGTHGCSHECVNVQGSYECACPFGMTVAEDKRLCILNDVCSYANCSHICERNGDTFKCTCPIGFVLRDDGISCKDFDECLEDEHDCSHDCVNTLGSYKCVCPEGLNLLKDGFTCEDLSCAEGLRQDGNGHCQDIDECLEEEHECSHLCINVYGSYRCSCPHGLSLSDDSVTCIVTEACSNAPCSHSCVPNGRNYKCTCPEGFRLSKNGTTCEDIDECLDKSNNCSFHCINNEGSYICECPKGFRLGEDNKSCIDIDECADGTNDCSQGCRNLNGTYKCLCPDGYAFSEDKRVCEDIDECQTSHNCSHECVNTPGWYDCVCPPGWELQGDSRTCRTSLDRNCSHTYEQDGNETRCGCPEGFQLGEDESTCGDVDECIDEEVHSCSHGCVNTKGSYRCECPNGFQLREDSKTCQDIDECVHGNDCSHGCENTEGSFECTCPKGYELTGDRRTCRDVDECAVGLHECSHRCDNFNGFHVCSCPEDLILGRDNKTCMEPCAGSHNCSHTCVNVVGGYVCSCPAGWKLAADEITCEEIELCTGCSHGCVNGSDGHHCSCPLGYVLASDNRNCVDRDECEEEGNEVNNGCSHSCVNTEGSYECSCPKGYQLAGDRRTCEDVNECMENNGGCSHLCANIDGSVECACPDNYKLLEDDGKTCVEIDDCLIDNGGCSHLCHYQNGTVSCFCPPGMILEDDDATCTEENRCYTNNGDCSHFCSYTDGKVVCSCPPEMALSENGTVCIETNPCLLDNGGCSHDCHYENGEVSCRCPSGMTLSDDRFCVYENKCFVNNGGCSDICSFSNGTIVCECPSGFKLKDNATCVDVDECLELLDNCTHKCINTVGGFECSCNEGFTVNHEEPSYCDDIDECEDANGGCSHTCLNMVGSFRCSCPSGYVLVNDNRTCNLIDGCKQNNGNCSHRCHHEEGAEKTHCSCPLGFSLKKDQRTCEDIDECKEFENDVELGCSHICVNTEGGYYCECPSGYILMPEDKKNCIDVNECLNSQHNCSHDCLNLLGSYVCTCYEGHYLHSDKSTCLDIDECRENNGDCSHHCTNTIGGHFCSCPPGYELSEDEKTCVDVDECKKGLADCFHECLNTPGSWKCSCPPGHVLGNDSRSCVDVDECETNNGGCSHACFNVAGGVRCSCPVGLRLDDTGKSCNDVDECSTENGGCSDICVNVEGSFSCRCFPGFHLAIDAKTCLDIDECETENGGCSDGCVNTEGAFRCECPAGFRLNDDRRTCDDVNECENNNGGCSHECVNERGSYRCSCSSGYELRNKSCHLADPCSYQNGGCEQICNARNGTAVCACNHGFRYDENDRSRCRDIDECSGEHGCDQLCANTVGSYECRCKHGYEMRNSICVDIDECAGRPCEGNKCINTEGSYRCECEAGYRFDGDSGCVDINECEWNNGRCEQDCINTAGSYICACRPGYISSQRNRTHCQDINECLNRNGGCNGECVNTPGSYYCTCAGELALASDERTCVPPEARCHAMELPPHAEIRCPGHSSGAVDYPAGARCHIRCRRGFKLEGPHTRYCMAGDRWSGKEPSCIPESIVTDPRYHSDMPRPFVRCPRDMDVELPARQNTIRVSFPQPKSNMNWWRYVDATPSWAKQLQADLPAGTTVVTFTAWSPVSNYTSTCRIVIRVRDTENPKVSTCPTSFEVRLSPGERNRLIFWQEPTFTDNVAVERVYKTREPGQLMYPGIHNVRYIASDAAGNRAECHFSIHVREPEHRRDSEPRYYRRRMLMCPGRPPQPIPSTAYGWQIPSGCYLRYTRIFSGAYAVQNYHGQNGYQEQPRAAYHEVHPIHGGQGRAQLPASYPLGDSPRLAQDENRMKAKTSWPNRARNLKNERSEDRVVTHYPVSTFDSASSSSVDLLLSTARRTISTPILQASGDNVRISRDETEGKTEGITKRQDMPKQSSSFIVTNAELPIVDISAFDYDAYRYKLIEATLRKQYADYQPPGDVVLNSIHLNNNDFNIGVKLNDDYQHSLFNFVEEYYDATKGMSKRETEYMHPLDHFLVKGTQRPETAEKGTETKRVDVADAADQDEKSTRISFYDDSVVGGSRRQESPKRDTKPRPSSGSAESSASKKSLLHRSPGRKSATKFSRTNSSTDSVSSKRETYRSLRTREDKHEIQSSVDGNERESMNCTTISSIDSESGLSVSSKQRDHSARSHDSSKSRGDTEKLWITGNTRASFNRKYGPTSRLLEPKKKSGTATKQSKQTLPRNLESNQADLEASLDRNSKKESIKMNSQQFGRLEAIKSETEELQSKPMPDLFIQDSTADSLGRSQQSTNYLSKAGSSRIQASRIMDPLIGDRRQRLLTQPRTSKTVHEGNVEESRVKDQRSLVKQQDKLRAPKSRTISPLTKQSIPKKELSSEAFASKEQPGNPVDPRRENSEKKKEVSNENIELCNNYIKKQVDQRRTGSIKSNYEGLQCKVESEEKSSIKSESPAKLDVHGRRSTLGSFRYKGENTKMNTSSAKVVSDARKTSHEVKNKEEHRTTVDVNSGELNSFGRRPTFDSFRNIEDRKHQDRADSDELTASGRRSGLESFRNNNTEDEKMNTERHQRKMKVNSARLNAPTKLNANSLRDKEEGKRVEYQGKIEVNNEKLNTIGNKEGKTNMENQGRDVRLSAYGRRATLDSFPSKDKKEEEKLSDFNRRRASSAIRNPIYSKGNVSSIAKSRSLQQRPVTGSRIDTGLLRDNARSLEIGGVKSSIRSELSPRLGKNQGKEAESDDLKLPRQDSKAGIAMQAGLKKYIKKLKRVLSNRDNADIGELASLSLTDALLPDLESTLSSVEVEQVQNLLTMAEKESDLIEKSTGLQNARLKKTVF